ncbi:MAG: MlaD family protein [Phycisphaerae bacterium]
MPSQRNALKVGSFTLAVVVLFFAVVLWLSKGVGGDMRTVTIHFTPSPSMPTIVPGSAVLIGGQRVGQVVEAELMPGDTSSAESEEGAPVPYVLVKAEIKEWLRLREDCSAIAEGPPLGGDGLIKLDLGSSTTDLQPGTFIQGSEPGGLGAIVSSLQGELDANDPDSLLGRIKAQLDPDAERSLMGKLGRSLSDINAMTASLARQLDPVQKATLMAKIQQIADNVNEATHQLRQEFDADEPDVLLQKIHLAMDAINDGLTSITRIVRSSEEPVARTLANLEQTSEHISLETDAAQADSLMAHLKRTAAKIDTAVADINVVTSTTSQIAILNRDKINRMLLNFKEASDHIKTGMKYVLRHPWRLFNEPKAKETRQQAIFDAARSFSDAAARIEDATSSLKALAEIHGGAIPVDDPDLALIRSDLKRTREKYRKAEAELWKQLGS